MSPSSFKTYRTDKCKTHHSKRRNDNRNKHSDDTFDLLYFVVDFDGYETKPRSYSQDENEDHLR